MNTQNKIGNVHIATKGLDRKRFLKICEKHNVSGSAMCEHANYYGCAYLENWHDWSGYCWITTNDPNPESRFVTLDELEKLILS